MADVAPSDRTRARDELERLHQGLAVSVGSKVIGRISAEEPGPGVDVQLAVQMVRDALEALNELRNLSASQQGELEAKSAELRRLEIDLVKSRSENAKLTSDLASLKETLQDTQRGLRDANDERKKINDSKAQTEESLKSLVDVIVKSFKK